MHRQAGSRPSRRKHLESERIASRVGPTLTCPSRGRAEAKQAGQLLKDGGYHFDIAYTSVLKRAIRTLWIVLDEMDLMYLPVRHDWRLNERHYGALQGLNKAETAAQFGEAQVKVWRRSYDVPPPPLEKSDPRYPGHDPRYAGLSAAELPSTESLKDTVARILPFWNDTLAACGAFRQSRVLVAAHGNSIRAMVKYLEQRVRERHCGCQHPDRHSAGVRTGRRVAAAQALLPRRPRGSGAGGARCRGPGEGGRRWLRPPAASFLDFLSRYRGSSAISA